MQERRNSIELCLSCTNHRYMIDILFPLKYAHGLVVLCFIVVKWRVSSRFIQFINPYFSGYFNSIRSMFWLKINYSEPPKYDMVLPTQAIQFKKIRWFCDNVISVIRIPIAGKTILISLSRYELYHMGAESPLPTIRRELEVCLCNLM